MGLIRYMGMGGFKGVAKIRRWKASTDPVSLRS